MRAVLQDLQHRVFVEKVHCVIASMRVLLNDLSLWLQLCRNIEVVFCDILVDIDSNVTGTYPNPVFELSIAVALWAEVFEICAISHEQNYSWLDMLV